jgi:hypothetical protein
MKSKLKLNYPDLDPWQMGPLYILVENVHEQVLPGDFPACQTMDTGFRNWPKVCSLDKDSRSLADKVSFCLPIELTPTGYRFQVELI